MTPLPPATRALGPRSWRRPWRPRARDSRGAAALEAALVTPLVMLLVFGTIEMALLMKDDVALTSAVRNGGRIASANAGAGAGGVDENGVCVSPCTPATSPKFAQMAAGAIEMSGTALPRDSIVELWIYKANADGLPGTARTTFPTTCPADCVRYRWVKAVDEFRYRDGTWAHREINACANSNPDSVGVYMKVRHDFLTGLFVDDIELEDHAVFTFEPLPTLTCARNTR